jgi:hypothetical protein
MNRLALILCVGALVAPVDALAVTAQTGNWLRFCQSGQIAKNLVGGAMACYTPAAGSATDAASPVLDVTACENVDIFYYADWDGDGTTCTVTYAIENCPPNANGLTDTLKNTACTTLPGTIDMGTGVGQSAVESNLAGVILRIRAEGAGANIDSCRVVVKCAISGVQ